MSGRARSALSGRSSKDSPKAMSHSRTIRESRRSSASTPVTAAKEMGNGSRPGGAISVRSEAPDLVRTKRDPVRESDSAKASTSKPTRRNRDISTASNTRESDILRDSDGSKSQTNRRSGAKAKITSSSRVDTKIELDSQLTKKDLCTSSVWLGRHGLVAQKLTREIVDGAGPLKLQSLAEKLNGATTDYDRRIEWLMSVNDGKKSFGTIIENSVLILLDHTIDNWDMLRSAFEPVMEEQLQCKKRVVIISVDSEGAHPSPLQAKDSHSGGMIDINSDEVQDQGERIDLMFRYVSQLGRKTSSGTPAALDSTSKATKKVTGSVMSLIGKAVQGVSDAVDTLGGRGDARTAHDRPDAYAEVDNAQGPNLFPALETAFKEASDNRRSEKHRIDAIYAIIGNHPKISFSSIEGSLQKLFIGKELPLNIINFGDFSEKTDSYLRNVVDLYGKIATGAPYPPRYHVMDEMEGGLAPGDDLFLLLDEKHRAGELIHRIEIREQENKSRSARTKLPEKEFVKANKATPKRKPVILSAAKETRTTRFRRTNGAASNAHTHIVQQAATAKLQAVKQNPSDAVDEPGHNKNSRAWLMANGLKAQRLSIYQEFQDVAYTCSKPGLFLGQSYKTMGTIPWHDGTEKTMHIDIGQMASYRDRLINHMRTINERISWLGTGSRRVFGNFCGNNVTFIIDVSSDIGQSLPLIKQHVKALIQDHLMSIGGGWFNIVKLDNKPERFKFDMVNITEYALNEAWDWVESWRPTAEPGRDLKQALNLAVDGLRPQMNGEHTIVLTCSGLPDQTESEIKRFANQMLADGSTTINTVGYNCYKDPEIVLLLREIARITGGEFQICVESGTVYDHMHDDSISWSTDSTLVFDKHEAAFADGQILDHYYEIARWVKLGGFIPNEAKKGGPSYGGLTNAIHTSLNHVLPEGIAVCLCDGTDAQGLRNEVFKAKEYLDTLDDIVKSLHPPYANLALEMLRRGESSADGEFQDRPKLDEALQAQVDALQRTTSSVSKSKVATPVLTKTARMRATHNQYSVKMKSKQAAENAEKERRKTHRLDVDPSESRKSRYMVTKRSSTAEKQDPSIYGPGEGRPLPTLNEQPAELPKEYKSSETSKEWLKKYGIKALHLTVKRFKKTLGYGIGSKGATVSPRHWEQYIQNLSKAIRIYSKRLKWLSEGDIQQQIFGTVPEENVVFAIDTSGSMEVFMDNIVDVVSKLVHGLPNKVHKFNVLKFSDKVETFSEDLDYGLIEANEAICACYENWIKTWDAFGGTNVRGALREASRDPNCEAVYLLSDGLPNESVLDIERKTLIRYSDGRWHDCYCPNGKCSCPSGERFPSVQELSTTGLKIHTISFNAGHDDPGSRPKINEFLQKIAKMTGGRYHEFESLRRHDGSVIPGEGRVRSDDIDLLQNEIDFANNLIAAAQSGKSEADEKIRMMLNKRANSKPKDTTTPWVPNGSSRFASKRPQVPTKRGQKVKMPTPRPTRGSTLLQEANRMKTGKLPNTRKISVDYETLSSSEDESVYTSDEGADFMVSEMRKDSRVVTKDRKPDKQVFFTSTGLVSGPVLMGRTTEPVSFAARNPEEYRESYPQFQAFVSGLPESGVSPSEIIQFFRKHLGIQLHKKDIDMPWDSLTKKPGLPVAYITFSSKAELLSALRLTGRTMGGQNIRITTAADPVLDTTNNLTPQVRKLGIV